MMISLPPARHDGTVSLEESLSRRRSVRRFTGTALPLAAVSQLLWAGQGISDGAGHRTAPSAGALYPLEMYLAAGSIIDLEPGVYRYKPGDHSLKNIRTGDVRADLCADALGQGAVRSSPASIVISAVYERTTGKYGRRGIRYVHLDAGHAAQNICLQAAALDLGTVPIGAFHDDRVRETLRLEAGEVPLYILPVGTHQPGV